MGKLIMLTGCFVPSNDFMLAGERDTFGIINVGSLYEPCHYYSLMDSIIFVMSYNFWKFDKLICLTCLGEA